jgi:c(7)-type cytochrome triheme protein
MAMTSKQRQWGRWMGAALMCATLLAPFFALADYGDVVMNALSEKNGARPVVFSHTFHRIRYRCNVCHSEQGLKMRAGGNVVSMLDIVDGKSCGACHNDTVAWGLENCNLCHSGIPGLSTQVVGGDKTGGPGRW